MQHADFTLTCVNGGMAATVTGPDKWRGSVLSAVAVLGVVLAVVALVRLASDRPEEPSPASRPGAPVDDGSSVGSEGGWRTETWRGVSIDVPSDWAVGGSPVKDGGSAGWVDCGSGVEPGTAYVGRPVALSGSCEPLDAEAIPAPDAAYVWFGSPWGPGRSDWPNGFESRTDVVAGQRVTVVADDQALRDRIAESARPAGPTDDNGCPAVQPDGVRAASALAGEVESLSVCLYERTVRTWELLWTGRQGVTEAAALAAAVAAGAPQQPSCQPDTTAPRVLLYVHATDGMAGYVVDPGCRELLVPGGALPLAPELVAPWSLPGVAIYSPVGA